ncbi:TetR/AcrR family transcriptional regulator [Oceanobacillus sp. 1P07AA]|uniref:TetR/AcrR family transcriptional regulator n=1 Tax=Oceanobacillus sp. 1P07AA TaxID=3132293 RepID=UPI0039A5E515
MPRNKDEDSKERILQIAEELFMKKGYRSVTTREISARCKISQPALYYHYPDKESLYIEMLTRFVKRIKSKLNLISDEPLEQRLRLMLEILADEHPTSIMMMIHDISVEFKHENKHKIYLLWRETYLEPFINVFEELKEKGKLRKHIAPEDAARFCLLTMGQTMSTWTRNTQSLSTQYDLLVDFILHGTVNS